MGEINRTKSIVTKYDKEKINTLLLKTTTILIFLIIMTIGIIIFISNIYLLFALLVVIVFISFFAFSIIGQCFIGKYNWPQYYEYKLMNESIIIDIPHMKYIVPIYDIQQIKKLPENFNSSIITLFKYDKNDILILPRWGYSNPFFFTLKSNSEYQIGDNKKEFNRGIICDDDNYSLFNHIITNYDVIINEDF